MQIRLTENHADRPRDRPRIRNHGTPRHRHVIPTGSRLVRHRNHQRLLRRQLIHCAPHIVGRHHFPARRIDPDDHSFQRTIAAHFLQHANESARFEPVAFPVFAARDGAFSDHKRNLILRTQPGRSVGNPRIVLLIGLLERRLTQRSLHLPEDFVFIANIVDQPGGLRIFRQKRTIVDRCANRRRILAAPLRDRVHQIPVQPVHQAVHHFLRLGAHRSFRPLVSVVFVFARVFHVHLHTELVERVLEKHQLEPDALQVEQIGRRHVNLRGRRGHIVIAQGRRAQPRNQRLARFAKRFQIRMNFLHGCPTGADVFRFEHDGLHA